MIKPTKADKELVCKILNMIEGDIGYERVMAGTAWGWAVQQCAKHRAQADTPDDGLARDWVECPCCHEPDMRMTTDSQGMSLIYCVNHGCISNNLTQPSERDVVVEALERIANYQGGTNYTCHTGMRGIAKDTLRQLKEAGRG